MEIVKYRPRYKKAIIDLAVKDGFKSVALDRLHKFLDNRKSIILCGLVNNRFKTAVIAYPIDTETVFVHYWVSKDKGSGVSIARQGIKAAVEMGFKYVEFFRAADGKYFRRVL